MPGYLQLFLALPQVLNTWCQVGKHCGSPYNCVMPDCWGFLPEYSVFQLYYGGQKGFGLLNDGVRTIDEIPGDFNLSDR